MPVILVAPKNSSFTKMLNVYEEVRSRYAPVVLITDSEIDIDNKVNIPYNEVFGDLLAVIPLQLIAYYLSLERGINPDFPRNLAKTVVVE